MKKLIFRKLNFGRDLSVLFQYMTDLDSQSLLCEQFQINTIQMFERWLGSRFEMSVYHDFFMIETTSGQTVGFTFSYNFSMDNGHCKYTLCLIDEYKGTGLGVLAAMQMLEYLFKAYPLRQIYISVYDYNKDSLSVNRKGGFEDVGTCPEYRYYDGKYHDLHILRLTREKFYIMRDKWNKRKIIK